MSSGSIVSGTPSSNDYYSRTWSGANGRETDNPYTMTMVRHSWRLGQYRGTASSPTCGLNLKVTPLAAPDLWSANDELTLLGKLAEQIRGHDFNLGTTAATSGQSVEMAVSTIKAIACAMRSLKMGHIRRAARCLGVSIGQRREKYIGKKLHSGDISGAWLALQYGWLPMLSDVFAAWEAVEAQNKKSEQSRKFTARHRRKNKVIAVSNGVEYFATTVRRKSIGYTLSANPSLGRELGLTDPLSILWEVMPWSFAIDWFIPIGQYLDVLNIIPHLQGSGYRTSKLTTDVTNKGWASKTPLNRNCPYPKYWRNTISFSRDLVFNGDFDLPAPNFRQGLSGKRIYNAIALAHQLIR